MMPKSRASIFEAAPELDVGSFAPKTAIDTSAPGPEQVRAVSQAAHFRSREVTAPTPEAPAPETPFRRAARRYRTGRNVQFNVKALKETVDAIYAISEAQDWVLGYTLERAMDALERELKAKP